MRESVRECVVSSYGEAAEGFLQLAGAKCQAVLQQSIHAFSELSDLPSWQVADNKPISLGGDYVNDLVIAAPVYLEDEKVWKQRLTRVIDVEFNIGEVNLTYVVQRRFDTNVSRLFGFPVVSYSEGILALVHSRSPKREVSVVLIDKKGVKKALVVTAAEERESNLFPDRRRRFTAYADALVGWDGKQKVYLPIENQEQIRYPDHYPEASTGPFRRTRWEKISIGEPTMIRPIDNELPSGSDRFPGLQQIFGIPEENEGGSGWDGPDEGDEAPSSEEEEVYNTGSVIIAGASGLSVSTPIEGPSGQIGYGPQGGAALSYGSCIHYNSRDECKNCCLSVFTVGLSTVIGAGIACHSVSSLCLPCHFACAVIEGFAASVFYFAHDSCQRNCDVPVQW